MLIDNRDIEKVLKKLDKLDLEDQGKVLSQINRKSVKGLHSDMQQNAPTDDIAKDIKIRKDKGDITGYTVGPSTDSYIARFLEYGTKVRQKRGKIEPRPFIRPAVDKNIEQIKDSLPKLYKKNLEKKIKKYL